MDAEWAEMHGYQHMKCRKCGWSGMTDGDRPECGCYDRDEGETCEDCGCSHKECSCSEGFASSGVASTETHVARKNHHGVKVGDTYKVTRTHYWRKNGPSYWQYRYTVISHAAVAA